MEWALDLCCDGSGGDVVKTKATIKWTQWTDWDALPVLMTVEEVCAVMKISETTALKLLNSGELPGRKIAGSWRISKSDLRTTVERIPQPEPPAQMETLCGIVKELLEEIRQMNTQKAG